MNAQLVELTPTKSATGNVTWKMCYKGSLCTNGGKHPDIVLGKDTGAHTIIFNINDQWGTGIRFPPKVEDAIWIQPGSKPTAKVIAPVDQLGQPLLLKKKDTLILTDQNKGNAVDLHYQLNFNDGSTIDPIIKNGGGTTFLSPTVEAIAWLVGAAVVGALLYVGFRRLFGK